VQAIVAWALLVISVHGPSSLAPAALTYVVAAWGLTAWIATRRRSSLMVVGLGFISVAVAPGIVAALSRIDEIQHDRLVAATSITNVHDEPILSQTTGRPIGVRVSYNVSVPSRGYYAITPWLTSRDPKTERLTLFPAVRAIDGSHEEKPFEPGKTHAMVVELYPQPLTFTKSERCLATAWLVQLPESTTARRLAIMISESPYGASYHGGRDEYTTGSYDLAELYRGVLAEGLEPCPSATPSP
jgi:hypothetical protein